MQLNWEELMGTAGAGVFENDAAMDARDDVTSHITSAIEDFLGAEMFGVEDTESVVAYVALLTGLIETCQANRPGLQKAAGWQGKVLEAFDNEIDELDPAPGFKEERRAVIVTTFERFLTACASDTTT
jgi:hypothetical protein